MRFGQSCILTSLCISQNAAQLPLKTRVQAKEVSRVTRLLKVRSVSSACRGQSCWQLPDTETGTRHSHGFQRMKVCRWRWQLSHRKKRYWRICTKVIMQVALHPNLLLCLDHCKCTISTAGHVLTGSLWNEVIVIPFSPVQDSQPGGHLKCAILFILKESIPWCCGVLILIYILPSSTTFDNTVN